jgi:hypothetical protein
MAVESYELERTADDSFKPDQIALLRGIVLAVALLLLTRNVTGRFTGHHDWNSAMYSQFARNHICYGLGYTKLLCTWGESKEPPAEPQWYLNHPPLIALWAAGPMLIFGDGEWVARIVPILASLGSVWLVMVILSRLHSHALGLLAGFFYATLPITAYFGRMLDHIAPVEFFSLLALHGYLQWAGHYGEAYARRRGALCYVVGIVLGVGTGWATLIMAALIWAWHVVRIVRGKRAGLLLLWLTLLPAVSLAAVILHILWARGWDWSMFGPLFLSRTSTPESAEPISWGSWFARQWEHLRANFTAIGAVAAAAFVLLGPIVRAVSRGDSPVRRALPGSTAVVAFALTGLHGLIYVFGFRYCSWIHDYWQMPAAPFVALALATIVLAVHAAIARFWTKLARLVLALVLLLPMPEFARALDDYYTKPPFMAQQVNALVELGQLVPPRAPVMTSWRLPVLADTYGTYVNRYPIPQIAYYADRPLIHTENLNQILENKRGCAAYICEQDRDARMRKLAQILSQRYETVTVGQHTLIVLLQKPK